MKTVIYLRIASVLTLLHAILHTVGGVFGKPQAGPPQTVVDAMKANTFPVLGAMRSYWEFYRGFGLAITIFLVGLAAVLWQLSSLAKTDACRLRGICWTIAATFVAMAVDSYFYFFLPPIVVELLIAACICGAIFASKPSQIRSS